MIAVLLLAWGWKSTAIVLLAMLAGRAARGRPAADRAAILLAAAAALLILAIFRFASLPQLSLGMPQDMSGPVAQIGGASTAAPPSAAAPAGFAAGGIASYAFDGPAIVGLVYLAGLLFLATHLLLGIRTLRRWTACAEAVAHPEWRRILAETAAAMGARPPRLLLSGHVPGPLSWGIFRPVILIDETSMRRTGDATAILMHELAHIVRRDWIGMILARVALILFWFNPFVWLLMRRLEDETESAADQRAARALGVTFYAQILVDYARQSWFSRVPALTMASTRRRLAKRIHALLSDKGEAPAGPVGRAGVAFAAAAAAVTLAVTVVALPLTTALLISAAGNGGRPVPARIVFPYLARYYAFPATERSRVEIAYRFTIGGKPAHSLGLTLDVGGRRAPIPLDAGGWARRLPSAAELAANAAVFAVRAPRQPVQLDIRPNLQTSIAPAREISAADCALAISQVQGGAKKAMGLLGFFLSKIRAVTFPGAVSGVAILENGRTVPLPQLEGSPAYDPQAIPSARLIRLARTPTIVDLETET
jgi:beta-lactamase regulating signal transducer with metallopeptidase domain